MGFPLSQRTAKEGTHLPITHPPTTNDQEPESDYGFGKGFTSPV